MRRTKGEGSITWSATHNRFKAYVTVDGKRRYFYGPKGDKTRNARYVLEQLIEQHARRPEGGTLAELIEQYVATAQVRPATRSSYSYAAKHILGDRIALQRITDLTPSMIADFYQRLTVGPFMVEKVHVLLRRTLEVATRRDLLDSNPAARVTKPKVEQKEQRVWTPDEVRRFLDAAKGHRLYALFLLALTSTMGPAELFALRTSDIHLEGGFVIVSRNQEEVSGKVTIGATKTKHRRRRIDLPDITLQALAKHMAGTKGHALFTAPEGGPIRRSAFRQRVWLPLIKEAGVPVIRFYDLRHTANALMGHLGVPLDLASRRMGHSSIGTTVDVYGHHYDGAQRQVAEKLDAFLTKGVRKGGTGPSRSVPRETRKPR